MLAKNIYVRLIYGKITPIMLMKVLFKVTIFLKGKYNYGDM